MVWRALRERGPAARLCAMPSRTGVCSCDRCAGLGGASARFLCEASLAATASGLRDVIMVAAD